MAIGLLLGLQIVIRRTTLGRAFRATSDDRRTAQLMGIDNRKLYAIAMAMAMATAAIAGVFLGIRTSFDPSDGPLRLIFAFEAVIIGGLGSLWGTLAGGIILGVAQASAPRSRSGWGVLAGHLVFLAILVVRPHGLFRGRSRHETLGRAPTTTSGSGLPSLAVVLLTVPWWASQSRSATSSSSSRCSRWRRCGTCSAGYAGLVSVGQQAFVGLGAYFLYIFGDNAGVQPFLAVALAGLVAAAVSIPTAAVAFRLRGGYFAIGTWVIAEVFRGLTVNGADLHVDVGGGNGVTILSAARLDRVVRAHGTYWWALGVGAGSVLLAYAILRSRVGLALTAIRDDEGAARSLGVNVLRTKVVVWIIAAFGCGLAGAVVYLNLVRVEPNAAFDVVHWTAYPIFIVVIGGIGTIEGPIIGTLVFFTLQKELANYGVWYLILLGAVAVVAAVFVRGGIWGVVERRFGLNLFPVQRRIRLPQTPPAR